MIFAKFMSLKLIWKILIICPFALSFYFLIWDGLASPMRIADLSPGVFTDVDGDYAIPLAIQAGGSVRPVLQGEIIDTRPYLLGSRIRSWNFETLFLGIYQKKKGNFDGSGFYHCTDVGLGDDLDSTSLLLPGPSLILRFRGWFAIPEWVLRGPLDGRLYSPLRNLLSDCALVPDPDRPNIRPQLDIPVIVGKDANGKDIIQMKPLITKVVKDDGQPIQVFTGNKKEDQYFDKKFNSP